MVTKISRWSSICGLTLRFCDVGRKDIRLITRTLPLLSFYSLCLQRPEGSSILGHDYRPLWSLKRKKMGCIVRVKSIPPIFFFFHITPPPFFFTLGGDIGMAVPPSFTILLMCFKVMMGDINNRKSPVSVWKRPLKTVDLFTVLDSTFRNSHCT